jgi:6-phosphogluconate dehydrogenase
LGQPKLIYLSLPAGHTIDKVLEELLPFLQRGDVIMDGGNSFYLDSIERERRLWSQKEIYFLYCGTSGGLDGARHGLQRADISKINNV